MPETWSYERRRRRDKTGTRWHFVSHATFDAGVPYEEQPYELYFRDDDRTQFGVLRFASRKDNPFRDYELIVTKIMNDEEFRRTHLDPKTVAIWRRSWK